MVRDWVASRMNNKNDHKLARGITELWTVIEQDT